MTGLNLITLLTYTKLKHMLKLLNPKQTDPIQFGSVYKQTKQNKQTGNNQKTKQLLIQFQSHSGETVPARCHLL